MAELRAPEFWVTRPRVLVVLSVFLRKVPNRGEILAGWCCSLGRAAPESILVSWVSGSDLWKGASVAKVWWPSSRISYAFIFLLQTNSPAAEVLSLSPYHPSSPPQISSSPCNKGFLSKLLFWPFTSFQQGSLTAPLQAPGSDKLLLYEAGQEDNDALQEK